MNIELKSVSDLIPYDKNPRNNSKAVKQVKASIEKFGFMVPLIIDRNNVVICGHTRLMALKELHMEKVHCVVADNLNVEEVKAFRLAENKVSRKAAWNLSLLESELTAIHFDMSDLGFDFDVNKRRHENKNQEMKTVNSYNGLDYNPERTEGAYCMPVLQPVADIDVEKWIGFNYAKTSKDYSAGIHFYLDDYQFERVWTTPDRYINMLSRFRAVMTPSFSVYMDMPRTIQIYNVYRARLLGQMMQDRGLTVIPIVYWGLSDTYDFCFDGLPANSILSIYTVGINDKEVADMFYAGLDELLKRKKPRKLLIYGNGNNLNYDFKDIEIVHIKNETISRLRGG